MFASNLHLKDKREPANLKCSKTCQGKRKILDRNPELCGCVGSDLYKTKMGQNKMLVEENGFSCAPQEAT